MKPISKEIIEDSIKNPEKNALPATELPVGTILPYIPNKLVRLPKGWIVAAGQPILRGDFIGENAPNLTDDRFIMGSINSITVEAGDNSIEKESLSHSWGRFDNTPCFGSTEGTRKYKGKLNNHDNHDHGGDKLPKYVGVIFIMRIE